MFEKFHTICVVGFGASSLNIRALISSVPSTKKPLVFLDSLDPLYVSNILSKIKPEETAFVVISKSGNTHETNVFLEYLQRNKYFAFDNLFVLCSAGESVTRNMVENISHKWINYPNTISGRFSLLERPFLDIASSLGVDIQALLDGSNTSLKTEELVLRWIKNHDSGKKTWVIINYNKRLDGLLLWIRQMVGESLGKNGFGITPLLVEGSMDEHSQLQLFLDGPDDKFYDVISSDYSTCDQNLADAQNEHASMVTKMLKDKGRDVVHAHHKMISEELVGTYICLYKRAITEVAEHFGFNPYSQPAVENIKQKSNEV